MAPSHGNTCQLTLNSNANKTCFINFFWRSSDSKDGQIHQLDTEVKALKSFILKQLYVIKKTIEDFKVQDNIPNNWLLIQSLTNYLRNENHKKTSIIKSLTGNHRFPAPVSPSDANQGKLHEQDHEHYLISEDTWQYPWIMKRS